MKLNCLSCGHCLDLRNNYGDYNGQVKCFVCGALLTIRTEDGQIRSVTLPSPRHTSSNPAPFDASSPRNAAGNRTPVDTFS
jgi:hypothetical protein